MLHELLIRADPSVEAGSAGLALAKEALSAGQPQQALEVVAVELRRQPNDPLTLVLGADAFNGYGQALPALELIQRARASDPSSAALKLVEAEQLLDLVRFEEAELILEQLLGQCPSPEATGIVALVRVRLARALQGLQRPEHALEVLQPLLDGAFPDNLSRDAAELGADLFLTLRRADQALLLAAHAHDTQKTVSSSRLLARCHFLLDDQLNYARVLSEATAAWPQDEALAALAALAQFDRQDPKTGWSLLEAARERGHGGPALRFVEARQRLLRGDFAGGWPAYEARLELSDNNLYAPCPPGWREHNPMGRTTVVVAEQGVGDVLFFSRFLPPLLENASSVLLLVEPRLKALLQRSYPEVVVLDQVELAKALAGPKALWIPIGSLPLFYGGDQIAISRGADRPQLQLSQRLWKHWRARLDAEAGPGARIGISLTAGGFDQDYQHRKRTVASDVVLAPLQDLPATLIDLQHRGRVQRIESTPNGMPRLLRFEEITRNLDHLCALLANLDLLITSDQTNAFLGGMLGIKTLVIVPPNPHFMMMDEGERTPWFDCLRIVRAPRWRDWNGASSAYESQLAQCIAESGSPSPRASGM